MADDTVTYKVQLDDTDLSSQLDNVRSRIDSAMAAAPVATSTFQQAGQLPNLGFPELPQQTARFSEQIDQQFWKNVNGSVGDNFGNNLSAINAKLDSFMATSYGAGQRFAGDMRAMAGWSGDYFSVPQPISPGMTPDPGMWNDALRAYTTFDGGFQYTGQVPPGEMRRQSITRMRDRIENGMNSMGFDAAGIAIGAPFGLGGALTGWSAGTAADAALGFFTRQQTEREELGQGLLAVSMSTRGGLTKSGAEEFAGELQKMYSSVENRARGFNIVSGEEAILNFANAGGYSYVRGAEEFKATTKELLDNYKQVAADLNVSFKEAQQFMATLNQNFLATPGQAGAFSSKIKVASELAGISEAQMLDIGMQGMSMFRQAGMGSEAGFMMAVDSRLQAQRMMDTGSDEVRRLIAESGGVDAFSQNQMRTLAGWGMSDMGTMSIAARLGGFDGSGGLPGMFGAAGAFVQQNPMNIMALQAYQARIVGSLGAEGGDMLNYMAMQPITDMLKMMPGTRDKDGKIYKDVFAGVLMNQMGIDANTAFGLIERGLSYSPQTAEVQQGLETLNQITTNQDINFNIPWHKRVYYGAAKGIDDFFTDVGWANNIKNEFTDFTHDVATDISDILSGTKTIHNEGKVRESVADATKEYIASKEYSDKIKNIITTVSGPNSPAKSEYLKNAAALEMKEFREDFYAGGSFWKEQHVQERRIDAMSPEENNLFAEATLGLTFEQKEKLLMYQHSNPEEAKVLLEQYKVDAERLSGADRTSAEYLTAQNKLRGYDVPNLRGMGYLARQETVSQAVWGTSYNLLTPNQLQAEKDSGVSGELSSYSASSAARANAAIRYETLQDEKAARSKAINLFSWGSVPLIDDILSGKLTKEKIVSDMEAIEKKPIHERSDAENKRLAQLSVADKDLSVKEINDAVNVAQAAHLMAGIETTVSAEMEARSLNKIENPEQYNQLRSAVAFKALQSSGLGIDVVLPASAALGIDQVKFLENFKKSRETAAEIRKMSEYFKDDVSAANLLFKTNPAAAAKYGISDQGQGGISYQAELVRILYSQLADSKGIKVYVEPPTKLGVTKD